MYSRLILYFLTLAESLFAVVTGFRLPIDHPYATHCVLHLIPLGGIEGAEELLASSIVQENQNGQPWMLLGRNNLTSANATSTGGHPAVPGENVHSSSRHNFCSVHLILGIESQGSKSHIAFENYAQGSWAENSESIVIYIVASGAMQVSPPLLDARLYNFQQFLLLPSEEDGEVFWLCNSCGEGVDLMHKLPPGGTIHGQEVGVLRATIGRHLHGNTVEVGDSYMKAEEMETPCLYLHLSRPPNVLLSKLDDKSDVYCKPRRRLPQEVVRAVNGTFRGVENAYNPEYSPSVSTSTVIYNDFISFEWTTFKRPLTPLPRDESRIWLSYCDYFARRARNDSHWTQAFDLATWVLILLSCLLVSLVSSLRSSGRIEFNVENFFNSFSLVTRGEGTTKRPVLQVAVGLAGFLILTHYEMFMTGMVVAPAAHAEFNSIRELLEHGYKIKAWIPNEGADPGASLLKHNFRRLGIEHLYYSAWLLQDYASFAKQTLEPFEAVVTYLEGKNVHVKMLRLFNTNLFCHMVPEIFGIMPRRMVFKGLFHDRLAVTTEAFLRSGLYAFWEKQRTDYHMDSFEYNMVRRMPPVDDGPKPVSTEFEVMIIFPLTGSLYALSFGVLLGELAWFTWTFLKTLNSASVVEYFPS